MNSVCLIGRLVRSPELKYTQNGDAVAEFSIAVDRKGKSDEADFFDVTAWRGQAESVASNLTKGRLVGVSGYLRQDRWQNAEGQNRSKVCITAHQVDFLDWPGDA